MQTAVFFAIWAGAIAPAFQTNAAPCAAVIVSHHPAENDPTLPADEEPISRDVAVALRPLLPRAAVVSKAGFVGAITDVATNAAPDDAVYAAYQLNSVAAIWTVGTVGEKVVVNAKILHGASTIGRGSSEASGKSRAALAAAAKAAATAAAGQAAAKLFCMQLTEHAVTIDWDDPSKRRHEFTANVEDIRGKPADNLPMTFKVQYGGGTATPEESTVKAGVARTTFTANEPVNFTLVATLPEPSGATLTDRAEITTTYTWDLTINGTRDIDLDKFSKAQGGILGAMMDAMHAIAPMVLGSDPVFAGNARQVDHLSLHPVKTENGYEGVATWDTTVAIPDGKMTSSQADVQVRVEPYTLSHEAKFTATKLNDAGDLHFVVEGLAVNVPSQGGLAFGRVKLHGMFGNLAGAVGMAPDQVTTLEPNRPQGAWFRLEFDLTMPKAGLAGMMTTVNVNGSDEFGSYAYRVKFRPPK